MQVRVAGHAGGRRGVRARPALADVFFDQYSAPHGNLWTGGGAKRGKIQRTKNVYAFYSVSSIERLPIETVLTSQTEKFKVIRLA